MGLGGLESLKGFLLAVGQFHFASRVPVRPLVTDEFWGRFLDDGQPDGAVVDGALVPNEIAGFIAIYAADAVEAVSGTDNLCSYKF